MQQVSVAACLVIEVPLALIILVPSRKARVFAGGCQVLLQVLILLTGNYTFFNALTILLCVPCFDDQCFGSVRGPPAPLPPLPSPSEGKAAKQAEQPPRKPGDGGGPRGGAGSPESGSHTLIFGLLVTALVSWLCSTMFALESTRSKGDDPLPLWDQYRLRYKLSVGETNRYISTALPYVLKGAVAWVALQVCRDVGGRVLGLASSGPRHQGAARKALRLLQAAVVGPAAGVVLLSSCVTFVSLSPGLRGGLPPVAMHVSRAANPYMISSSYGLFRRMTGMGKDQTDAHGRHVSRVARPEVIIEGSDDNGKTWREIEFAFKPGRVDRRPPVVAPHQPRLDWQMWFAALGSYQHNPWFIHLLDKILEGSEDVLGLLDPDHSFADSPPTLIRSWLFSYDFTRANTSWRPPGTKVANAGSGGGDWWARAEAGEYTPPIDHRNPSVTDMLSSLGWARPSKAAKNTAARCNQAAKRPLTYWATPSWAPAVSSAGVCQAVLRARLLRLTFSNLLSLLAAGVCLRLAVRSLFTRLEK